VEINNAALAGEYAWSGWFRWTPCDQKPWHLAVRLAITGDGVNENMKWLGDRTLAAFIGNGVL
jgi:hypothetical protein